MRIAQTFRVARPPEAVFDEMTDPAKLASWQTSKTLVEQLTPGPPGLGTRVRERTKPPGGREFEQIVEFTEFDRPRRFTVHVVQGPQPIDGTWSLAPDGDATRVEFVGAGELRGAWRLLGPVVSRAIARQFRGYHDKLRRNLEGSG
jgi:carbon monoxide dehydrogenase subunit G